MSNKLFELLEKQGYKGQDSSLRESLLNQGIIWRQKSFNPDHYQFYYKVRSPTGEKYITLDATTLKESEFKSDFG